MIPLRLAISMALLVAAMSTFGCSSGANTDAALNVAQRPVLEIAPDGLVFEPKSLELPDLTVNTSRSFSLLVRNTGPKQATVKSVSAGCACTNVTISEKTLRTGDSAKITGVFRAGREPGESSRSVVVMTEDGKSFDAPIKARILRSLVWNPASLTLRPDILEGRFAEGELRVSNLGEEPVTVNSVTCEDGGMIAEIRQATATKSNEALIRVRASPNMLRRGTVRLTCLTSHTSENLLEVPLYVQPVHYLEAAPSSIHLGVLTPEQLDKRLIKASVRGPLIKHLCFQRVEYPSSVVATIETRTEDEIACVLKPVADHSGAALSGTVKFVFERNAENIVISIPVWGIIDTRKAHSLNRRQSL